MNKSKYIDVPSIMQVIGGVYLNPAILDEDEKYFFNKEDFPEEFHRILFGTIHDLYKLGSKKITSIDIENYLESRPKKFAVYKNNKGEDYLNKLSEITQLSAFDYYYNKMKKMTLLREYSKIGMDLSWLYDADNILDVKKKQLQEDWLDNTPLVDIADTIDKKIEEIKLKYIDDADLTYSQAGDGIDNLLEGLQKNPEIGYPLSDGMFNSVCRGARLGKFYLRSAATGVGKALPNSTIIPTPSGDKRVEDIRPGDYLFDAFGKPTLVRAIYPQGEKEVWEITFKDGRKARCCEEHLWSYCTESQRKEAKEGRKFYTDTLKDISKKELYQKGHGYKILVPMQKAVEYEEKEYYIKPYSFGLLLGDGSFRYNKEQKALSYSSEDEILPSKIADEMNWNYKKNSKFNYNWTFEWKDNLVHKNVWVEEALKDFPTLWNVKSEDKYIPNEYLKGSVSQRFDLLNGLLDSDGSVDKEKGRVSYYTISSKLKDNVVELARSLGFKTSVLEDSHKDTNVCYKVEISGQPEEKIKLFKLDRKKKLILQWYNNGKRKESNLFNPIIEIKKLDYSEEMTCFYVDNEEHLFLMNDYIVTHNTRSMVADFCSIGCDELYDIDKKEWVQNNTKEPALYIVTEQELDEIQTMMIAYIANVDEDHILYNNYIEGEYDRVLHAAKLIKNCSMYVKRLPDFSLQDIENTIKIGIREYGAKYVFFDYIHSSIKILSEVSSRAGVKGLREDNVLFMISVKLKDLCTKYGIFLLSSTQLNGDYKQENENRYDQNMLRGAKAIADKIDFGAIMLETTEQDKESLAEVLKKGGFEMPDIKISIYKNRRGRYKSILLWCKAERGTCRITSMFATTYNYELVQINELKINIKRPEASAF